MSWIDRHQGWINFILLAIVTLILSIFVELVATSFVNDSKENFPFSKEFKKFYMKYSSKSNHLRKPSFIYNIGPGRQPEVFGRRANINDLIFSSPYKIDENKPTILVQGDSWAQQFLRYDTDDLQNKLTPLTANSNLIVAGVNSYSPSLMTAQLKYLRDDFDVNPSVLIAIIDQTDIGDEICRYRHLRHLDKKTGEVVVRNFDYRRDDKNSNVYEVLRQFRYSDILDKESINTLKLAKIAALQVEINISNLLNDQTCAWNDIAAPLYGFITLEDKEYFKSTVFDYINFVLKQAAIEKLVIVSHYHMLHSTGEYKINVSNLIDEVLTAESYHFDRSRVSHVKFLPSNKLSDEIFYVKDVASHLRSSGHSGHYLEGIIREIKF